MPSSKVLPILFLLICLAFFILGCSSNIPEHSAGLATKEEEVASGEWENRKRAELPIYFKKHLKEKVKEIKNIYADGKNKELIIFFTDYHIEENQGFSPLLIKELDANLPVNMIVFGGDIYDKGPSVEEAWHKMQAFKALFSFAESKWYGVIGNHEFNTSLGNRKKHPEAALTSETLQQRIFGKELLKSGGYSEDGDYWVDRQEVRYFFLGTNTQQNLRARQYSWLFGELEKLPPGKQVMLFSHLGCGNAKAKGTVAKPMVPVLAGLEALKEGQDFLWQGKTYKYKKSKALVIGCLSGHVHKDDITCSNGITVAATARDALRFDPDKKQTRKPGTISEQVIDVVILDKLQHKVDLVRIGHGKNRSFSY